MKLTARSLQSGWKVAFNLTVCLIVRFFGLGFRILGARGFRRLRARTCKGRFVHLCRGDAKFLDLFHQVLNQLCFPIPTPNSEAVSCNLRP